MNTCENNSAPASEPSSAACLILEPMPLVAHDLATTLRDRLRCPALIATSEEQATSLLSELDPAARLRMAIIRMKPPLFADSPLRPLIEARCARVILMGSDASTMEDAKPWPWALLEWPFGTGQLLALLDSLGLSPEPGPGLPKVGGAGPEGPTEADAR